MDRMSKTILKASAGTGKTYRLSLEYIAGLVKKINYRNIIVMTFTKKATAEIKERIYDFLYQIAFEKYNWENLENNLKEIYGFSKEDINKEELRNIYFEMIKNKDEVRIYTIDGFTNKIFKNTIAPFFGIYNYETLDEEEEEFYEDILIRMLNNDDYFQKMKFIFEEKRDSKNISTYIEFIKGVINIHEKFILAGDFKTETDKKSNDRFVGDIENIFNMIKSTAEIKNGNVKEFINGTFKEIYEKFEEINKKFFNNKTENIKEKKEILLENQEEFFKGKIWNGNKIKGKEVTAILEEIKECQEQFLKNFSEYIFINGILPLHNKITEIADIIYNIAEQMKFSSKRFTHTDISTYTYKFIFNKDLGFVKNEKMTEDFFELIGGNANIIMVDEFQDTSILQWKILKLLLNSVENIVCVGDEKQSIYNWRGGEKELFEKLDVFIEGKVENLDKSYRSYREIIENINKIFENYNNEWIYTPVKYRSDEEYQKGYFSYYLQERKIKYTKEEEKPEFAFEEIIRMIKDGKIKNLGRACIICRKNRHLNEIAQRLNEENIPYTMNSNSSILEHKAIFPLYKLIKFFIFDNFIYFLEFMRSDLIGCLNSHVKYFLENRYEIEKYIKEKSSEKFEDFVSKENKGKEGLSNYVHINEMTRNNRIFSEVLFKVKKLKGLSESLNSGYLKENFSKGLIEEFEAINFYSTNSDIKNIFKFFNILKKYDDLFEFINDIENKREKVKQLSSEDNDTLNLMSIHKSKGLEFDTVIYYKHETGRQLKDDNLSVYFDYDEKFEKVEKFLITLPKYDKVLINGEYSQIREKNRKKEKMESINNDYVALTRAKKNLMLFFEAVKTKEGFKDNLVKRLLEIYGENFKYFIGKISESEKTENKMIDNQENNLDGIMTYFSDNILKIPVTKYETDLDGEFRRKKGLAMHYYFEHVINNPEADMKIAKSVFLSRYGNMLGKKILTELLERMEKFIFKNKELYSKKYKIYTEFEIYDKENNKRIIDRINIDENEKRIFIYDYKTGFEPEKNEKYIEQLKEYKNILTEKTEGKYEIFTKILEV
ncbi:exodeoxyribonuclease V subunit beta [Leptotrichia sp. OH3620_COT-345]|uniref:UvrD-helicase domain-containing protein n=1 Tax=Leptotrichia sp. OH3620_COT-345 TaxID=2491048 RepID=UPI001F3ED60E|nr:UvrD-helicase domain-containing protein [Leptotrichia sp. OH3620_COT-345]